jgi:hypothetical protein
VLDECGICGAYHPPGFEGDCRDDKNRYGLPDRFQVVLIPHGFLVVDASTIDGEIVRGAFSQRFKAQRVADELNNREEVTSR